MTDAEQIEKSAQINFALGFFILFFGIVTMIAMFFSGTHTGRNTNLVAGLVLFFIGSGMCIKSKIDLKKLKRE